MSITPRTLRIPPDIVSLAAPFVHTCVWHAFVVLASAYGTVILPPPPLQLLLLLLLLPLLQCISPLLLCRLPLHSHVPLLLRHNVHPFRVILPPLPLSHQKKKIVFVPLDPTFTPTLPTSSPPMPSSSTIPHIWSQTSPFLHSQLSQSSSARS